jgi:hypothetical protein
MLQDKLIKLCLHQMRCWWFVGNLNNIYMPTSVNSLDFLQDHCMIGAVCFYVHKLCILIACVFYFSATIRILLSGDCWWAERSAKLRPLRWVTWRCLRRHHCRSMYCVFRLGIHMRGKTFAGKSHFMFFVSPVGRGLPLITPMPDLCIRHFVGCVASCKWVH